MIMIMVMILQLLILASFQTSFCRWTLGICFTAADEGQTSNSMCLREFNILACLRCGLHYSVEIPMGCLIYGDRKVTRVTKLQHRMLITDHLNKVLYGNVHYTWITLFHYLSTSIISNRAGSVWIDGSFSACWSAMRFREIWPSSIDECVTYMMMSLNGNIFCVIGSLCREFTGRQWIPTTKASDAEL